MKKSVEKLLQRKTTAVSSAILAFSGTTADFYSHSQAQFLNDGTTYFPHRSELPAPIAEHIGNFGITATLVILGTAIGALINIEAEKRGSEKLGMIGKLTQIFSLIAVTIANLSVETQFLLNKAYISENMMDLSFAAISLISSVVLINALESRAKRRI